MPRKLSVPATTDVLRSGLESGDVTADPEPSEARLEEETRRRSSTGRVRHDEKITVYVSSDELVRLEQARLTLRSEHGMRIDRGRIVREAVAEALDELAAHGPDSTLVERLRDS